MSQAESEPRWSGPCRECGAENDPGASECWLCHRRDWHASSRLPTSPKPAPSRMFGMVLSVNALAALGMVVLGGLAIVAGLFIWPLLVCVLPAWAITEAIRRPSPRSADVRHGASPVDRRSDSPDPIVVITALGIALFAVCMFISR